MGIKRREISCVWKGTNNTAGEGACRKRNHPEDVTTCHRNTLHLECRDKEHLKSSDDPFAHPSSEIQAVILANMTELPNSGMLPFKLY